MSNHIKVRFRIESNNKRPWTTRANGTLSGRVRWRNQWWAEQALLDELAKLPLNTDWQQLVSEWEGFFALIWQPMPDYLIAVVDPARSIPLLWKAGEQSIIVTNQVTDTTKPMPSSWFRAGALYQAEFVPGHATLFADWQQLKAGELLEVKDGQASIHTHFSHRRPTAYSASEEELRQQFRSVLTGAIDRLIEYANGTTIVVPLSGGYDSRILLSILAEKNYPALQCFTYGQPASKEARIGEAVAQQLGAPWRFVHYTPTLLQEFFDDEWTAYSLYAGGGYALPQDQDFLALQQLTKQGALPGDSIICPGFCGDFQAGSYLPRTFGPELSGLQHFLYHKFTRHPNQNWADLWTSVLPTQAIDNYHHYTSELEQWVLTEYVTKYIVNGIRAYEWFGYDWYLPLWDREFLRFWQAVPNELRKNMKLYRQTMEQAWFVPQGISFPEDKIPPSLRQKIMAYLPLGWKQALRKLIPPPPHQDINGMHQLVGQIQQQLQWEASDLRRSVNEMQGHWHLELFAKEHFN